jgi:hypothetical protein
MNKTPDNPIALEARQEKVNRLYSPSTARNKQYISTILADILPNTARVLEIGSGTGEHAVAACTARTDITWQPSDPDETSRLSQEAWAECQSLDQILKPLCIDASKQNWAENFEPFDVLFCANVIHISPWAVACGLALAAKAKLLPDGLIYLYGPYLEGNMTSVSNLEFDQSLRSRNPEWGVRSLDRVEALFNESGFVLARRIEMPSNNLSLIFRHRADHATS